MVLLLENDVFVEQMEMVLGLCKDTIQARDHFVCTDESPTGLINGTRGNIEIKSDGNEEACFKY